MKKQDLTDRAMKPWQPVRLNGIVTSADYTSGDFGADHTTGYHDGEDAPTGGYADESDPAEFDGLDWDMGVQPDPSFNYLASKYRPHVAVEIEHFAIALGGGGPHGERYQTYFPKTGDWVQAVGRWITDNGHPQEDDFTDGFYTEIHPPEMMVSTRYFDQMTAEARVVVTGAWLGSTLNFVVNPPARPSANATLKWDVFRADGSRGFDRKDKCELELVGRGGASPAYVRATVRETAPAKIIQYNTAVVGMDGSRGLQCIVRVWWEDKVSGASGQLRTAGGAARGAHLFYRDGSSSKTPWIMIGVDATGRYSLGNLRAGGKYWLRPGGSGWTFTGVPELWTVPAARVTKDFAATRTADAVARAMRQMAGRTARTSGGAVAVGRAGAGQAVSVTPGGKGRPQQGGPLQAVRSLLVTFEEPSGKFGVAQNGMGYPESGIVKLQLRGMVDFDNKPVASLQAACTTESDGSVRLEGAAGPGVANAKVRARLLLGNPGVGYRLAQESVAQTDAEGFVGFRFTTGSRMEDGVIECHDPRESLQPVVHALVRRARVDVLSRVDARRRRRGRLPHRAGGQLRGERRGQRLRRRSSRAREAHRRPEEGRSNPQAAGTARHAGAEKGGRGPHQVSRARAQARSRSGSAPYAPAGAGCCSLRPRRPGPASGSGG